MTTSPKFVAAAILYVRRLRKAPDFLPFYDILKVENDQPTQSLRVLRKLGGFTSPGTSFILAFMFALEAARGRVYTYRKGGNWCVFVMSSKGVSDFDRGKVEAAVTKPKWKLSGIACTSALGVCLIVFSALAMYAVDAGGWLRWGVIILAAPVVASTAFVAIRDALTKDTYPTGPCWQVRGAASTGGRTYVEAKERLLETEPHPVLVSHTYSSRLLKQLRTLETDPNYWVMLKENGTTGRFVCAIRKNQVTE